MIHSGVGATAVKNFMAAVEIPGLHHTSMNKRRSEVGRHARSLAKDLCKKAIREEKSLYGNDESAISETATVEIHQPVAEPTLNNDQPVLETTVGNNQPVAATTQNIAEANVDNNSLPVDSDEHLFAEFKYDMAWQKRGSGRCYDSKSGVGTMIGNRSGKICAYGVRIKDCRTCNLNINKGKEPPKHNCVKNWNGSLKAMEPDVGGECVLAVEKENVKVGVIIMDDDCTTMARIKQELSHNVEKWSGLNHTVKHLGNSLYNLAKKHKCLSSKVIKWIQKCFNYAVAQNKGDVDGCSRSLSQIVPHAFGDHSGCGHWCGYIQNAENYRHKSLPYGRDLSGEDLRSDLASVFSIFVKNAHKIAPGGSTKDVESFNNMLAIKTPKRCHFSATENLLNRVDCTVAQKNMGLTYLNKINESLGISPGKVFEKHAQKEDKTRKRRIKYENSIEFKKRKIDRKLQQKMQNSTKELREGDTYKSGIAATHMADVTEIPGPSSVTFQKMQFETFQNTKKVYCDIETSSLHKDADILQIAAICGNDNFDQYIMPTKPIAPGAAAVTGLSTQGHVLFYHNKPVNTLPLKEAIQVFLDWLQRNKPCTLIGHNFTKFDFPRLLRAFKITHFTNNLKEHVLGIVDTLPMFQKYLPGLEKNTQEHLVTSLLKEKYNAHNALGDVESLQKLCNSLQVTHEQMCYCSVSVNSAIDMQNYRTSCQTNITSLQTLKDKKILSKGMVDKIGNSGLCLEHLLLAASRSGIEGLTQVLSEKVNGKPRVTSTKKIIEGLYKYLKG